MILKDKADVPTIKRFDQLFKYFQIHIRRRTIYYFNNLIGPCVLIASMVSKQTLVAGISDSKHIQNMKFDSKHKNKIFSRAGDLWIPNTSRLRGEAHPLHHNPHVAHLLHEHGLSNFVLYDLVCRVLSSCDLAFILGGKK